MLGSRALCHLPSGSNPLLMKLMQLTLERLTRQKEPVVRRVKADQDEESIEVTQHIAEETRLDPSNAVAGFNYFCSQTTPEWFAVQVTSPVLADRADHPASFRLEIHCKWRQYSRQCEVPALELYLISCSIVLFTELQSQLEANEE